MSPTLMARTRVFIAELGITPKDLMLLAHALHAEDKAAALFPKRSDAAAHSPEVKAGTAGSVGYPDLDKVLADPGLRAKVEAFVVDLVTSCVSRRSSSF